MSNIPSFEDLRDHVGEGLIADSTLIAGVISLLVAVHFALPSTVKSQLVFDHQEFNPWTLLTSAAVHANAEHLAVNGLAFLLAAVMAAMICRELGERRWFHITTLAFLLVLPIIVNLTSYGILELISPSSTPTGRGFSGVVSGYVGFVLAGFLVWSARKTSWMIAQYIGFAIVLILAFETALIYSGLRLSLVAVTMAGLAATGLGLSRELNLREIRQRRRGIVPEISFGALVVLSLVLFIRLLFPADIVVGGMVVNIFAHGAGFIYGGILAFVFWRVQQ